MPNLTIHMEEGLLRAAKMYGAEHKVSISRVVRDYLKQLTGYRPEAADELLVRYSEGEVAREEVLETLNLNYFQLLDLIEEQHISRPRVTDEIAERMSNEMVIILREVELAEGHTDHP